MSSISFGESNNKLAFINLDWSLISSRQLYKCIHSHLIDKNSLISVSIHFTKESKLHFPEIVFKNPELLNFDSKSINEVNNAVDNKLSIEEELVKLDKFKKSLFIAVATFKNQHEAENIYKLLDGVEIEETNNYIDARFVNCELFEVVSTCIENPVIFKDCGILEEAEVEREEIIDNLFNDEEEEFDDEVINKIIDISDDIKDYNKKEVPRMIRNKGNGSEDYNKKKPGKRREKRLELEDYNKKEPGKRREKGVEVNNTGACKKKDLRKGKKKKDKNKENKDDFVMDIQDSRFGDVFKGEEFMIDVTHNQYKKNPSCKEIAREKRRRNKEID